MNTILSEIVDNKKIEVKERSLRHTIDLIHQCIPFSTKPVSLRQQLLSEGASGIIAEFKQHSPSLGVINDHVDVNQITTGYVAAGVSALSVLTETRFFGGSLENFSTARRLNKCPMLQKDFFIDEYQIYEARALGADVILLIAAILTTKEVKKFATLAASLGMESILEVHTEEELRKLCDEVSLVGVNNRDLKTFVTDLCRAEDLSLKIPKGFVKIAESGIKTPADVIRLRKAGYQGFLIGERFMSQPDPVQACTDFIQQIQSNYYSSSNK
jgi:indole-3-glycerol phosphate synthase